MAIPGLVAASNLADTENKEAVWDNLGNGIDAAIPTTNLLLRSEELGVSPWFTLNTTITSNLIEAPNGTLTADMLTDTNPAGDAYLAQPIADPLNSGVYAVSVYLKQGTTASSAIEISFFGGTTIIFTVIIRWDTKTTDFNIGSLADVGNGWYRLSLSAANNASNNTLLYFAIRASGDGTGVETGTVYAWGAQVELAEEAGPYVPTTTAPVSASPTASIVIQGDDILELIGARLAATSDFVRIKGLTTLAQPRLTTAAANVASGTALRDNALLKASPSSEGDYFLSRGTLDGQSLRVNGLNIASLSGSPFSGDTASCPLLISSFAAPTNLRINNAMASGTLAFPERAIPIETDQFIFYAKAGQS
jgi:hypothetical protein